MRSDARTEFLGDIIVTAVEGGTGYWAQVSQYQYDETLLDPKGVRVIVGERQGDATQATLHELNDDESGYRDEGLELTLDAVARGIGRIKSGEIGVNSRLRKEILIGDRENDAGNIDADGADVIVQAGLLGEIRYG